MLSSKIQIVSALFLGLVARQVAAQLDVAFVLDTSDSTLDDIALLRNPPIMPVIQNIMTRVRAETEADTQFGIVAFQDYPILPFGLETDEPYILVADLQDDIANVTAVALQMMNSLDPGEGNDRPESILTAFFQMLTGDGQEVDEITIPEDLELEFREDAQKIIVLFTGNPFHAPERVPSYPGPSFATVIDLLTDEDVDPAFKVVGISPTDQADTVADMERLTNATGSQATGDFDCFDGTHINEGEELVCVGASGDAQDLEDAFVNMIVAAYVVPDEFVPLTCSGLYALVCVITGGIGAILSFFT